MSVKVKIKKRNGNSSLDKILKDLDKRINTKIKVGWFSDQGSHPSPRGNWSYASLAYFHKVGYPELNIPPRDPLGSTAFQLLRKSSAEFMISKLIKEYFSPKYEPTRKADELADYIIFKTQSSFGSGGDLEDNEESTVKKKGANSPLFETGALRKALTKRIER